MLPPHRRNDRHAYRVAGIEEHPPRRPEPAHRALDPQASKRPLDVLGTDDAFRRRFTRDPATALARVGLIRPEGAIAPNDCFWGITQLAPKTQIAPTRDGIRLMLTRGLAQTAPQLDAGLAGTRTRK